jgi:hypothetical protein
MHIVEYEKVQFKLINPLNSSVYVGTSNAMEDAWMDIAYRKFSPISQSCSLDLL